MATSISLAGSRADRSETLRRLVFGPCSLVIELSGAALLIYGALTVGDPLPFVEALGMLWFTIGVLHRFISEEMERELPSLPIDPRDAVSPDVLRHLPGVHSVTAVDLLAACVASSRGSFVLRELRIDAAALLHAGKDLLSEVDARTVLLGTVGTLSRYGSRRIDAGHLLAYFMRDSSAVLHGMLNAADASEEDLDAVVRWEALHERSRHAPPSWAPEQLLESLGGMGRSWVMGYNTVLERLTEDLSYQVRKAKHATILHQDVMRNVMTILKRQIRNNALILGRVGSGRWSLLQHLAGALHHSELIGGQPLSRVLLLRTQSLLSAGAHPDADLLQALEARDGGRYIIVIRDLPLLLKGGDARLLGVLLKLLQSPNVAVIGIADPHDYHAIIRQKPGVDTLFERVSVEEPNVQEVLEVLMEEYFALERSARITMPYRIFQMIIAMSERYVGGMSFPGKAVEVLREVIAMARSERVSCVTEEMVRTAISLRAHQDLAEITSGERDGYLHLEEHLRSKIVGQVEAVHTIAAALMRGKLEIGNRTRPIGTFLLLGPTGVGKTETAKAIASMLFGGPDRMIRLDMNEYSEPDATQRIVGGGDAAGYLTQKIQDHPSSLILLDELEKAHPHVLNLFLQILDEGHLLDGDGVKVDFRSSVIVATSNAGAGALQQIARTVRDPVELRRRLVDAIVSAGTYSPEFLNRFDEVIVYHPLSEDEAKQVAMLMIGEIVTALQKEKGVTLTIDAAALRAIAAKGYSPEFGARAMRRAIQDTLENAIAERFLRTPPKRGETIAVAMADLKMGG